MTYSNGVAILTSIYPVGEMGRVLGINVAAVYTCFLVPFWEDC